MRKRNKNKNNNILPRNKHSSWIHGIRVSSEFQN